MTIRNICIFLICVLNFPTLQAIESENLNNDIPAPDKYISEHLSHLGQIQIGDSLISAGIRLNSQRKIKPALLYFNKALEIGENERDYRLQFLAINNTGLCYYVSSEFAKALDYFYRAHEIAIRYLPQNYHLTILNNISVVYNADNKPEKALQFLTQAYEGAINMELYSKAADYGINLGTLYNVIGEYEKAREVLKKSMQYTEEGSDNYYLAKISLSESYELDNQLYKAYNILIELIQNEAEIKDEILIFAYTRSARILNLLGRNNEALRYALRGAEISKIINDINFEHFAYNLLSNISESMGNYKDAYEYLLYANDLQKEIQLLKEQEKLAELQAQFEVSRYEHELVVADEKYSAMRKMYNIIFSILAFLILLSAYTIRIHWVNMKQKNILLHKKEQITSLELEYSEAQRITLEQEIKYKEEQSNLREKILEEELEKKNKEIASKVLISAAKSDVISQVIEQIDKLSEQNIQISSIKNELKSTINLEKDWDDFVVHFEQTHTGFFQKLISRHPDLNNNDLRFAAYLKINMGGKEIARLLSITPASYRKRKTRFKEKLCLEKDETLEKYIHSL
jgi:tetratricopeptide (TPR) repeat protein